MRGHRNTGAATPGGSRSTWGARPMDAPVYGRTVRGSSRDAEREMSRLVVEVDEGRHAASAPMTLGELLDRWLEVKRASVAPRTIESYEWIAAKHLRPRSGERKLASLRTMDLDELYAELHASGLSARTVRICHTVIRQSLDPR